MLINGSNDLRKHPLSRIEYRAMDETNEMLLTYIVNYLALTDNSGYWEEFLSGYNR